MNLCLCLRFESLLFLFDVPVEGSLCLSLSRKDNVSLEQLEFRALWKPAPARFFLVVDFVQFLNTGSGSHER
jgi:hypothetical protein